MSFTDKIVTSYQGAGTSVASVSGSYTGDGLEEYDDIIPAGATNKEIDIAFPVSSLQSLAIVPAVDMTMKTNSSGSPQDTILLKAGIGIIWAKDFPNACPLSGAITKLFMTNAGAKDGRLQVRALFNTLP